MSSSYKRFVGFALLFLFQAQVFASPLAVNSTKVVKDKTFVEFLYNRVPNTEDVLTDALWVAAADVVFDAIIGELFKDLKKDPNAASIVRDSVKTGTTAQKYSRGLEVGSTGVFYDHDHMHSQFIKVSTKIAQILIFNKVFDVEMAVAGKRANYASDVLSRAIIVAGRDWRTSGQEVSFEEYFFANFKKSWVVSAIVEVLPKGYVTATVSTQLLKNTHSVDFIRGSVFKIMNKAFVSLPQSHKKNFMQNYEGLKDHHEKLNSYSFMYRNSVRGLFALTSYISFVATNHVSTVVLAPPAKWAMDGLGYANDYFYRQN